MGDRANVVIDEENDKGHIFLYTHWGGPDLPLTLQKALAKRWRWGDEAYLAKIIFREMIRGCEDEETGFGISTTPPDNEHPYLRVSTKFQTVTVNDSVTPDKVFTFDKYVNISNICWRVLRDSEKKG